MWRSLVLVCLAGGLFLPLPVKAEVSVTPFIIDRETAPRDLFEQTITVKNATDLPTRVFASVNAIEVDEGGNIKSFSTAYGDDRATSITSWIGIDRGRIELPPGAEESRTLSFTIHPEAKPGVYHAFVGFGAGSNRDEAQAQALSGKAPGVIVRLSIPDERQEALRLARFTVERVLLGNERDTISVTLTNPGDVPLVPDAEVVLYNGRGEEVGTVPLNTEGRMVAPGETTEFKGAPTMDGLLGKYKAYVRIAYGEGQSANITDTAFFYVAPLPYLIGLFAVLFVMCLGMVFWWRRYVLPEEEEKESEYLPLYIRSGTKSDAKDHDITLNPPTQT